MSKDPVATFGLLLQGCISDNHEGAKRRTLVEGALFLLLGAGSAFLTRYLFAIFGIFV